MSNSVFSRVTKRAPSRMLWRQTFAALVQAAMLEPRCVEITHERIAIPKLPREFHGFRIVQLSDIHHSPFLSESEIAEAARRANELQPDAIALTGDYVTHSRDYIAGCARALGNLRARDGVFAVLGNHDLRTDGEFIERSLRDQGIQVLRNQNVLIKRDEARIFLAGVDDLLYAHDDLVAALENAPRDQTRILLAHNPRIIREAARAGVDLVLSGHTHGGQINWRLLIGRDDRKTARWLRRPSRRFMRGHTHLGSTQLYVNRGLGTVILPLRYGCPPEITLLELVNPIGRI